MIDVDVTLSGNWDSVQRALIGAPTQLRADLKKGTRKVGAPMAQAIREDIPLYMPSGYAPILAAALKVRVSSIPFGIRLTGKARGRGRPREIRTMNAGRLRAPSWPHGPRRTWSWHTQAIRPGWFTKPPLSKVGKWKADLEQVLEDVARRIANG
jgi:hypothetical protein